MCPVQYRSSLRAHLGFLFAAVSLAPFLVVASGCSKAQDEAQADTNEAAHANPSQLQADDSPEVSRADDGPAPLPALQVDPDAPTVDDKHPGLASSALVHARLAELSDGTLLRAGDIVILQKDIDAEVAKAPAELREQLSQNAFFLLEQIATQNLLVQEARQAGASSTGDERMMLQAYFQTLVKDAQASDPEIAEFYEQNKEVMGGATLEDVSAQIRQYLIQHKQQQIVTQHIQTFAQRTPVAVSAKWVDAQAQQAKDNPVDKARASGKPTLVSFGADTCVPCQQMIPTREAVSTKYAGKANVVYVHVGEEQILASRYGVQGIPFLMFFDADGREFHRHTGVMSQEQIEEQFRLMGVRD